MSYIDGNFPKAMKILVKTFVQTVGDIPGLGVPLDILGPDKGEVLFRNPICIRIPLGLRLGGDDGLIQGYQILLEYRQLGLSGCKPGISSGKSEIGAVRWVTLLVYVNLKLSQRSIVGVPNEHG